MVLARTNTATAKIQHRLHREKLGARRKHCHSPPGLLPSRAFLRWSVTIRPWRRGRARNTLSRISYDEAYPGIEILPRSRNWWAWLKGTPPECIHLGEDCDWIATLLPDTLYLKGKRAQRSDLVRPEITLCRRCLESAIAADLESFAGRVVAFEPDPELFTQYFFVGQPDFQAAGLRPDVAASIAKRLGQNDQACSECGFPAKWLWFSREEIASLDEVARIAEAPGEWYCAKHGARNLLAAFARIGDANIFYMNLPYGEAGAYVWI
jgi:hypothetical protein